MSFVLSEQGERDTERRPDNQSRGPVVYWSGAFRRTVLVGQGSGDVRILFLQYAHRW